MYQNGLQQHHMHVVAVQKLQPLSTHQGIQGFPQCIHALQYLQLGFGFGLSEGFLEHHFERVLLLGLQAGAPIGLRETAFAEQLALMGGFYMKE